MLDLTDFLQSNTRFLLHWAQTRPDAVAVRFGTTAATYGQLAAQVVRCAKALEAAGVGRGHLVGLQTGGGVLHLMLILAIESLGAVSVTLDDTVLDKTVDLLARCDLICAEREHAQFGLARRVLRLEYAWFSATAALPVGPADAGRLAGAVAAADGVYVLQTSGTTGARKSMVQTWAMVASAIQVTAQLYGRGGGRFDFVSLYQFDFRPTYTDSMLAIRSGGTIHFAATDTLAETIAQAGPLAHTVLLPRDATDLVRRIDASATMARCIVMINGGGAPAWLRQALLARFATEVVNCYSLNETNFIALLDGDGRGEVLADVAVRVVDAQDRDVAEGEEGGILVRSPRMIDGYLWDEARSAAAFVDGWFRTNDLGRLSGRMLQVIGRADDMINVGGIKIAPAPIETEVRAALGTCDVALVGVDDGTGCCRLYLVLEGAAEAATEADLQAFCAPLAAVAGGLTVRWVPRFPRTETGKLRRSALVGLVTEGQGV